MLTILCGLLVGLILCSHTAYAADENIPSDLGLEGSVSDPSNSISAEDDYILREISKALAEQVYSTSDVRATDYTQLIYNYLTTNIAPNQVSIYQLLGGGTSGGSYINQIKNILYNGSGTPAANRSLYHLISDIWESCHSATFSQSGGGTLLGYSAIIYDAVTTASGDTLANMLSTVMANSSSSAYTSSVSSNTLQSIFNKLDNYINCSDIVWTTVSGVTFYGASASYDINTQFVNTAFDSDVMMLKFSIPNTVVNSVFSRISLPIDLSPNMNLKVTMLNTAGMPIEFEYFVAGRTLYLLGFPKYFGSTAYLFLDAGENEIYFNPSRTFKIDTTSMNNIEAIQKISNFAIMDINHKLRFLEDIEKVIANEDIEQAREESSPTTKQALEEFTGDGSSAPTPSTVSTASDISDSMAEGFDTGESADSALTAFNPASALWGWFSEDNASYFTPNVPNRSGSENKNNWDNITWTDDIPNLTPVIEQDIHDLTRGEDK